MFNVDSAKGNIRMGGKGGDGDIIMFPAGADDINVDNQATIHLDATPGNFWMGGKGQDGDIVLYPSDATEIHNTDQASIWLDAGRGNMMLGGAGQDGDIALFPSDETISQTDHSAASIRLDANGGNLWMGGKGRDGDIVLFPAGATDTSSVDQATIHLDADAGDISLQNADCAEEFDTAEEDVEAGTVMVLDDDDGSLRTSTEEYDTRVAGVVSGAGDHKPGIVLDRQSGQRDRLPIALMGKVSCKVDASPTPIDTGDMLTTADEPGHAMKAVDPNLSFGAVLGKALRPLTSGQGIVPVLVALQ